MSFYAHPTAEVSVEAVIGAGTRIWHQAQIRQGVRIGEQCLIGKGSYVDFEVVIGHRCKLRNGVFVYHGATLEDGVFLGPGVMLLNDKNPRAINPGRTTLNRGSFAPLFNQSGGLFGHRSAPFGGRPTGWGHPKIE